MVRPFGVCHEQSPEIELESPHCIYHEYRPANDKNDVRRVLARKMSKLYQATLRAAENGHATAVSILLEFASRNGFNPRSVIDREIIKKTIENGHAAVFEVLAMADPTVATFNDFQGKRPLDLAIASNKDNVAAVVLQYGGGREFSIQHQHSSSYRQFRLCQPFDLREQP